MQPRFCNLRLSFFMKKQLALAHNYRPSSLDDSPPVIIMLHGYGSDENDLFSFIRQLVDEDLVLPGSVDKESRRAEVMGIKEVSYTTPELVIYRDMGDLLALDPPLPGLDEIPWKDDPNGVEQTVKD